MTWSLHHEWSPGAYINGAQLATCRHCGALRVTQPWGSSYIRPKMAQGKRVTDREPVCVELPKPRTPRRRPRADVLPSDHDRDDGTSPDGLEGADGGRVGRVDDAFAVVRPDAVERGPRDRARTDGGDHVRALRERVDPRGADRLDAGPRHRGDALAGRDELARGDGRRSVSGDDSRPLSRHDDRGGRRAARDRRRRLLPRAEEAMKGGGLLVLAAIAGLGIAVFLLAKKQEQIAPSAPLPAPPAPGFNPTV